jgi:hypothetical protein
MSTSCSIILKVEGGYKWIYCHYDGYIEDGGVGEKLLNHYTSKRKISNLIRGGDIEALGVDIDTTRFYNPDGEPHFTKHIGSMKYEYNYKFDGQWYVMSEHVDNNFYIPLKAATQVKKDYMEFICVNNRGMEDMFSLNEVYVSVKRHHDLDMIYIYDNHGVEQECFSERFRIKLNDPDLKKLIAEV